MAELMRRQYLVTEDQVSKLEDISKAEGVSATEVVRRAIDAYHSNDADEMAAPDLMALVSSRLKETIADTQKTRRRLTKTLKKLGAQS